MKRIVMALLMAAMVISLTGCGGNAGQNGNSSSDTLDREQSPAPVEESASVQPETGSTPEPSGSADLTDTDGTGAADIQDVPDEEGSKVLVAYFSATGTTKGVAEVIAENMGADIYEIVPQEPYMDADLNWHDDKSRSSIEMNDSSSRPGIDGAVEDMEQYTTVFIGYPIWWGQAPKIMYTFMESYDFSGKTIVPFCTSGSSSIGSSATNLEKITSGAVWKSGTRFSGSASQNTLMEWVRGLGLNLGD